MTIQQIINNINRNSSDRFKYLRNRNIKMIEYFDKYNNIWRDKDQCYSVTKDGEQFNQDVFKFILPILQSKIWIPEEQKYYHDRPTIIAMATDEEVDFLRTLNDHAPDKHFCMLEGDTPFEGIRIDANACNSKNKIEIQHFSKDKLIEFALANGLKIRGEFKMLPPPIEKPKKKAEPIKTNVKYKATINIEFEADLEEIRESLGIDYNPSRKEIDQYFADKQDEYAGSNTGSEMLANAELTIVGPI